MALLSFKNVLGGVPGHVGRPGSGAARNDIIDFRTIQDASGGEVGSVLFTPGESGFMPFDLSSAKFASARIGSSISGGSRVQNATILDNGVKRNIQIKLTQDAASRLLKPTGKGFFGSLPTFDSSTLQTGDIESLAVMGLDRASGFDLANRLGKDSGREVLQTYTGPSGSGVLTQSAAGRSALSLAHTVSATASGGRRGRRLKLSSAQK